MSKAIGGFFLSVFKQVRHFLLHICFFVIIFFTLSHNDLLWIGLDSQKVQDPLPVPSLCTKKRTKAPQFV
jgi:hypothetical protein